MRNLLYSILFYFPLIFSIFKWHIRILLLTRILTMLIFLTFTKFLILIFKKSPLMPQSNFFYFLSLTFSIFKWQIRIQPPTRILNMLFFLPYPRLECSPKPPQVFYGAMPFSVCADVTVTLRCITASWFVAV